MRISDWMSDVCSSDLAGLQEGGRVPEEVAVKLHLVVGGLVHEGELVALGVKILEILGVEPHPLHRFRRAEADVGLAPVDQVLQLHLHICAALAGLGVLDLDRAPQRSEEHTSELQSLMRISYAVFCLKKQKHT